MSLLRKTTTKWKAGDLITASDASALLGYKSPKQFQDATRLQHLVNEFKTVGCKLTTEITIGGGRRFLRSEIELFISRKIEIAQVSAGNAFGLNA